VEPLEYYRSRFKVDLAKLGGGRSAGGRISVVSLVPSGQPKGSFEEVGRVFSRLPNKRLFLFCFFFSSLLDQAIHSGIRGEHHFFDSIARYPKFCGILATYYHNLHPALLLLVATLYTSKDEYDCSIQDFRQLSDFFINDYCHLFTKRYPQLTGRLATTAEQHSAIRRVLNEMSSALAILFLPKSLRPYSAQPADTELCELWVSYFRDLVNDRLARYERFPENPSDFIA